MNTGVLETTSQALLAPGRGTLAADESHGTITRRFEALGIEATEEHRRRYRQMLFTTPGVSEFISGVILFDETMRQRADDGRRFVEVLAGDGITSGIKVDRGAQPLAGCPRRARHRGARRHCARTTGVPSARRPFAKWRAVIVIGAGRPSASCLDANAHALGRYAALCQEAGLVPIVEPEVLMDGDHSIERCFEVTEATLDRVVAALRSQHVILEHLLLKPNIVVPGAQCPQPASVARVAEATVRCLRRAVPAAVPGIVFLSGGQDAQVATAVYKLYAESFKGPDHLRRIQDEAQAAIQDVFRTRA
jgi:fructose-bisphosphate aldolase class I